MAFNLLKWKRMEGGPSQGIEEDSLYKFAKGKNGQWLIVIWRQIGESITIVPGSMCAYDVKDLIAQCDPDQIDGGEGN
jgi:hypothetical protein